MKFMFIVKSAHAMGPSPKLLEEMHKLTNREIEAGRLLDNGALTPMAMGAQVRIADGRLTLIDGPFGQGRQVVGGYSAFELKHKEESLALARAFIPLPKNRLPKWEA